MSCRIRDTFVKKFSYMFFLPVSTRSPWRFLPPITYKTFSTKFKSNKWCALNIRWSVASIRFRSLPPLLTSDPQNCPIRGVIDLYEQHGLNSVNIIYHIWVIQKSWTDQNSRFPTLTQTPLSLAHGYCTRPSSATHSKLEVLKVY